MTDAEDGIHLLRTMEQHLAHVRAGLQKINHDLERRALLHDLSKFGSEEFPGFCEINAGRETEWGSDEHRAQQRREKTTIEAHYRANSHHPEHHAPQSMGFLDLIEMVCDWRAAYLAYGNGGMTWEENVRSQQERYGSQLGPERLWLVGQVADYIGSGPGVE